MCYGGKLEAYSAVNRWPMKLLKKRFRMGKTISLEINSGKGVLNPLVFIFDIKRCSEENRIGVVETGADDSMSLRVKGDAV